MTDRPTQTELIESITGYDELATQEHFNLDPYVGDPAHPLALVRALVFIHQRHSGADDKKAKAHALSLPIKDVHTYFADEEDEPFPDDPATEQGKDDSEPDALPTTSPSFAGSPA